jgi:Cu/Zn superoxide dismutase
MKTKQLLSSALFSMLFAFNANANHLKDNLLISAKLNGAQEVPAVTTNAQGVGSFMINATRDTVCINISVTGLSGAITGIHLHDGALGMSGGVIKDLTPYVVGNRITAKLTGVDASAANISKLLSGKIYVNVHTAANPNGEIRGQLYLETDWSYSVIMNGAQETPSVTTMAYGVGVFNLSKDLSKIKFNIVTQGLNGASSGAHLHYGGIGMSGGVSVDLTSNINGNVISGTIMNPTTMLIDSLMAGKIYLNVHNAANPNGEIRGQLMNSKSYLYFDAALNGAQETPAITTTAMGAATIKINTTYDTLWYDVSVDGLSGTISGAHFHNGVVGASGGVEFDMSPDIMGNRIMGKITGATLTTTLINKFLRGEIYMNLHTSANPNGEIRGQVYRLAREGYTYAMTGAQETPMVTTSATGSGIVSIDRDQDNAHYMFVASGLTSGGAHFHKGAMGQAGGVLYDLSSYYMNNGAFGYWKSTDSSPFTLANSLLFRNDSVYVNIHTSANANGEIRGQVLRGFECYNTTSTGIDEQNALSGITVSPNPTSGNVTVRFNTSYSNMTTIIVMDVLGKEVYNEVIDTTTSNQKMIDLKELTTGLYFVKIMNGKEQFVQKLIKN